MVAAIAGTAISGRPIQCSENELAIMQPPAGQTCGDYLSPYAAKAGGNIINPTATADCGYCPLVSSDQYLAQVSITYGTRWRDYGIGFVFIFFNIFMAVFLYYFFRVRKSSGKGLGEKLKGVTRLFRKDPEAGPKGKEKAKTAQNKEEKVLP